MFALSLDLVTHAWSDTYKIAFRYLVSFNSIAMFDTNDRHHFEKPIAYTDVSL